MQGGFDRRGSAAGLITPSCSGVDDIGSLSHRGRRPSQMKAAAAQAEDKGGTANAGATAGHLKVRAHVAGAVRVALLWNLQELPDVHMCRW